MTILKGVYGPFDHADGSNGGTTAEDRYYGAFHPDGISKITISNAHGGIEVDHLQLDHCFICGDTNFDSKLKASDALTALSRREGSTPFMTLVAALKVLLYGYTGEEDLRVATLLARRQPPEVEGVIGLFADIAILRTRAWVIVAGIARAILAAVLPASRADRLDVAATPAKG